MKKIAIMAAAAVLSTALYAGSTTSAQEEALKARQEQMLKVLQRELDLSDKQVKKWGEIQSRYLKQQLKLYEEQNKEINALMTKEQREKYEALQQRMREQLAKRMKAAQ